MLRCFTFDNMLVKVLIPSRLPSVKGVVWGVDCCMNSFAVLNQFAVLGAVEVYQGSSVKVCRRVPTE